MDIEHILSSGANVQLIVNPADLREYSIKLIDSVLKKDDQNSKESFLTTNEAAQYLGVTYTTMWRYEKNNYLVPIRIGGRKRYRLSDLEKINGKETNL